MIYSPQKYPKQTFVINYYITLGIWWVFALNFIYIIENDYFRTLPVSKYHI